MSKMKERLLELIEKETLTPAEEKEMKDIWKTPQFIGDNVRDDSGDENGDWDRHKPEGT